MRWIRSSIPARTTTTPRRAGMKALRLSRATRSAATSAVRTAKSLTRCGAPVLASVGKLAVLPAQDLLDLGSEARLNRPGTVSGNWSWRLPPEALTQADGAALS